MSATSVGQIGLDLVVNQKQFNKQMQGITGVAKKAGAALAVAFSIKKLVEFGKECVELGSDLEEVQNVVDVVFPSMTKQVDGFAKSAAISFGLSETMAKKFTGTFGAMSKAFGFTEKQAYDMSTTLTGLAGDVASFYDISQDLAYTKLKSVFSGETETLKDLGIVMTQAALDEYALAIGIGKVTKAMSEQEKVALRYMFVQDKLSAAQGDFSRTSGSWANQVRILKLQFDSLKATIGQGFINVLTPVIKVINTLIGKLITLANAFKAFTELITGNKSGAAAAAKVTDGLADSTEGVGKAAKKAAKELKSLMGFDELNNISSSNGASDDDISSFDFGSLAEGQAAIESADSKLNPFLERVKELANLFKKGFQLGLGEDFDKRVEKLKDNIQGIKEAFIAIATDPEVQESFNGMLDKMAISAGQIAGAYVSIGTSMAINLTGGIKKYLEQDAPYIKERLIGIFDNAGEIAALAGEFAQTVAGIFTVFESETAQQVTANLIGIFSNAFLGITELFLRFKADLFKLLVQPIIDNAEKIKEAIANTLQPLETVTGAINDFIKNTFDKIFEVYDTKVRPAFEGITEGLSSIFSTVLDTYNTYIAPVLQRWADQFDSLVKDKIQPAVDALVELFGDIATLVETLWNTYLVPFINWIASTIIPIVMPVIEKIGSVVMKVFGSVMTILQGLFEALSGIIKFLVGVFTGDWDKAWEGIRQIFEGVIKVITGFWDTFWQSIKGIYEIAIEALKAALLSAYEYIKSKIDKAVESVNKALGFVASALKDGKNTIIGIFDSIKTAISSKINAAKDAVKGAIDKIKSFFKFEWSLPKIKLPHFTMEGSFSLSPPSVPKLGVNWYAKGGIIKTPTLAMMGEGGKKEAVVPLEQNLGWRDAIVGKILESMPQGGAGQGFTLSELIAALRSLLPELAALISTDVVVEISKREVFRAVKEECDENTKRTGKNGL